MVRLLLFLLMPVSLPHAASALRCSVCNSAREASCRDAPEKHYKECPPPPVDSSSDHGSSDGDRANGTAAAANATEPTEKPVTLCRKTIVEFYKPNLEMRVYRSCGYKPDTKKDCRTFRPIGISVSVCQCFDDFCNRGPSTSGLSPATLLSGLLAFFAIR